MPNRPLAKPTPMSVILLATFANELINAITYAEPLLTCDSLLRYTE